MKYCFLFFGLTYILNSQNTVQTADQLYATGNYTKAIEAYQAIENDINFAKIAKAYVAIGNYQKGLENYKWAIENNPDDDLLQYDYAKLLTRTKKYDEANKLFNNLVEKDSLNPNYHYELGVVLEKQNDSTAINMFMNAFGLDLTHQKAIFKIAKHHLVKRNFKIAQRFIDKGLESYANNIELTSLKAQTYYYQEFYTHSVVWFNKLLELGETSEFIHEKLSLSYAHNSDYKDAIYHRKKALKYNPYDTNAMFVIGGYYERLSNYEKAEEWITKALKMQDVSLTNEYQRLGTILNRQKKYEEAIKAFQKSLKEDPSNIMTEFFLIRTKDEFYADVDAKISMYEAYLKKHAKTLFVTFAEKRLEELKQEKFLEKE